MPNVSRKHVKHYRTSGTTPPLSGELPYGELAMSYNSNHEKLFIKNTNDDVVEFSSDDQLTTIINQQDLKVANAVGLSFSADLSTHTVDYEYSPSDSVLSGFTNVRDAVDYLSTAKYDKTGGDINGNVKVIGDFKLHISDDDYDVGIGFNRSLDNNLGVILNLNGYVDNTNYRPLVRNIGTPSQSYDAANKKYVDDHVLIPNYHLVELNLDGSVNTHSSTLVYSTVASNLTNPDKADYLDILWENGQGTNQFTRFYAKCIGIREVNSGDLIFVSIVYYLGMNILMVFALDTNNDLTTITSLPIETLENKKNSVVSHSASTESYPTTKAVYDEFQRKPVVIWETSGAGLLAIGADIAETVNWQLTNLDMTPYKRVKIYTKAGKKSSGIGIEASNTPAVVLEMSLDSRAAGPTGGHYLGSAVGQKPNDSNRLFTVTCAISSDKTSFAVLRMTNLYGTAATDNTDTNAYVWKIEGYYD